MKKIISIILVVPTILCTTSPVLAFNIGEYYDCGGKHKNHSDFIGFNEDGTKKYGYFDCTVGDLVVGNDVKFIELIQCKYLTSIKIPDAENSVFYAIGDDAFYRSAFKTIIFPKNIWQTRKHDGTPQEPRKYELGRNVFAGCDELTAVIFKSTEPPEIRYNTFDCVSSDFTIYVPIGSRAAYEAELVDDIDIIARDSEYPHCKRKSGELGYWRWIWSIYEEGETPHPGESVWRDYNIVEVDFCEVCDEFPCICTPTTITLNTLQSLKDNNEIYELELPNGFAVTIDPETITDFAKAIDLNIDVIITSESTVIGNSKVPANSIVINPAAHGEFGFEVSLHLPKEFLAENGLNGNSARLFYVGDDGKVSEGGKNTLNKDGSMTITFSHASSYFVQEIQVGNITDFGGAGIVTIQDALEILKYLAGLNSAIADGNPAYYAALIVSNDVPKISDAIEILKLLAELPSVLG